MHVKLTGARVASAVAMVAALMMLAACGGSDADDAATTAVESVAANRNGADVEFAQMMIVHHEGAIEMADFIVEHGDGDEVRALGRRIGAAQGPEIALMASWLEAWGEAVDAGHIDHGGMDHGGMEMGGLDQQGAMDALAGTSGAATDRLFLELMIEHHRGAVEMAQRLLAEGENPDAAALARTIVEDQEAEIVEMERMLAAL